MTELESTIRDIADSFAKSVLDALRKMTLAELAWLLRPSVAASTAGATTKRPAKTAKAPARPKKKSSFRQLQGRYMGLIRNFTGAVRKQIKGIAKAKGLPAAIAAMAKLLASKTKATKPKPVAAKAAPRKLKLSPARKAALKIQGTYIGLVRGLPAAQKAKIKALAKKKGMKAAVEAMKRGRK